MLKIGAVVAGFAARIVGRGLAGLWRVSRRRPLDALGSVVAATAVMAIVINAVFLQPSAHPAPIFAARPRPVAAETTASIAKAMPPRRPADVKPDLNAAVVSRPRAAIVTDIQRELARRHYYDGAVDGVYGPKTDAAVRDFANTAGIKVKGEPDEALLRIIARAPLKVSAAAAHGQPAHAQPAHAPSSARIRAVQRALGDFGYGQIQPTGTLGPETKAAIERFERRHKLPITGQISDRLVREIAAMTGRPLE